MRPIQPVAPVRTAPVPRFPVLVPPGSRHRMDVRGPGWQPALDGRWMCRVHCGSSHSGERTGNVGRSGSGTSGPAEQELVYVIRAPFDAVRSIPVHEAKSGTSPSCPQCATNRSAWSGTTPRGALPGDLHGAGTDPPTLRRLADSCRSSTPRRPRYAPRYAGCRRPPEPSRSSNVWRAPIGSRVEAAHDIRSEQEDHGLRRLR